MILHLEFLEKFDCNRKYELKELTLKNPLKLRSLGKVNKFCTDLSENEVGVLRFEQIRKGLR